MPTLPRQFDLPRQSESTAFRSGGYASNAVPAPSRRVSVPAPVPPASPRPVPLAPPRQRVQTRWLMALVVVALIVVSVGMLYLSGHAQVTQEGYRRTKLLNAIKREREAQQQWRQRKALMNTPAYIGKQALGLDMVPAEESQRVTVGETRPEQLLPPPVTVPAVDGNLAPAPAPGSVTTKAVEAGKGE